MSASNYWKICIEESLSEIGIAATDEQIEQLAECVEGAHENHGMAHGYDCIPNPAETARKEAERKHKADMAEAEERERILKKNIANRYGQPVRVSIVNGCVEVERAR